MIFLYGLFSTAFAILLFPAILLAFIIQPKLKAGFWQKIGFYKKNTSNKKTLLIHAVSVGEVNAVEQLVKQARQEFKDYHIILSTVTKTGQEVANNKLKDFTDEIIYFPYDLIFCVSSCLNAKKPDLIVIAETEIWPMFSYIANLKNIPLVIVNGRISPKSHNGYKKVSFFFKKILSLYSSILMQGEGDRQRIVDIGAPFEKTKIMGNLKFDIEKSLSEDEIQKLKNEIKLGENKLFIAASTHKGEDEIVLNVFKELKSKHKDAKLLIAPRHPQRYEQVETLIKQTKFAYSKRSLGGNFEDNEIIMLDTMGELSKFFSQGYVAFIGGSFSTTGGHNPLEANIWDVPVISGSCVFNFKDIYKLLTETKAATIVKSEKEFTQTLDKFYSDATFKEAASNDCKQIFDSSRGALKFALNELKNFL